MLEVTPDALNVLAQSRIWPDGLWSLAKVGQDGRVAVLTDLVQQAVIIPMGSRDHIYGVT